MRINGTRGIGARTLRDLWGRRRATERVPLRLVARGDVVDLNARHRAHAPQLVP